MKTEFEKSITSALLIKPGCTLHELYIHSWTYQTEQIYYVREI
jgi:hypothetical protein